MSLDSQMAYTNAVRKRNLISLVTLLVSAFGLLLYWWFTHPRSEAEAVRRVLAAMEQAAERKQPSSFMRHISDRYLDEAGNTKRTLGQLVFRACRSHERYEVVVNNPRIQVVDNTATVHTNVEVLIEGQDAARLPLVLKLEKELLGGWLVVSSEGWQGQF